MATVTSMTAAAIETALAAKADLVGGVVPDSQVPAIAVKRGDLVVNVKDHGAVGNGIAFDDAALIASIAAVPAVGGEVFLPAGSYLLNGTAALTLAASGITIRGAGAEATKIVIASGFTGGTAISISGSNCKVQDLTIAGASSTTTSNPVAGAIYISPGKHAKVERCNFFYINAWAIDVISLGTSTGNPDGTILSDLYFSQCAGGIKLLGNPASSYAMNAFLSNIQIMGTGVTTGASANFDGVHIEDCWDVLITNLLVWCTAGTGNAFHLVGNTVSVFVHNLDAGGPATGSNALIEDGTNGSPQNIQITGGVLQQALNGLRITGGSNNIHVTTMRVQSNQKHGVSVEGSGVAIHLRDIFTFGNGAGASGSNYDINWSGTSTGYALDCRLASGITTVGTAGVQASVNAALNQTGVRWLNMAFSGAAAAAANWFTNAQLGVLETTSGVLNFASIVNLTSGARVSGNLALQPSTSTAVVASANVGGTAAFDAFRLTADGNMNVGAAGGGTARDTTWGRQGAAQFGTPDSDIVIGAVGKGLKLKEGTNARMGTATLVAGLVTVNNTSITANTRVFIGCKTPLGTAGGLFLSGLTIGASFAIRSTSSADTSVVSYLLIEAA